MSLDEKYPWLLARVRRFTLLDAMVLIGALALCLVIPTRVSGTAPGSNLLDL